VPFLKQHAGFVAFVQAVLDSSLIFAAGLIAARFTMPVDESLPLMDHYLGYLAYMVLFVVVWCGAATDQRIYKSHRDEALSAELFIAAKAVALALIFTGFVLAFFGREALDRQFLVYFGVAAMALIMLLRVIVRLTLWTLRRRGYNFRRLLIIGANERGLRLVDTVLRQGRFGYVISGVLDDDSSRAEVFGKQNVPWRGKLDELEALLAREVVDEVYITLPVRSYYEQIQDVAQLCEGVGVPVRMLADLFPLQIASSRVYHLDDIPILSLSSVPEAHGQLVLKRCLDLAMSSLCLMILGPLVMLPVAILIKLESRGRIFFLQERVGLNKRPFKIVKFRSMVQDAESQRDELETLNEADGPVFKMKRDPRITRVGRFIRKYSIDELPQLFNVWLGHMSLVGPRPPIMSEVEQYS
jgi:exopolysaccharide biosynthesis polyprenyl glycosylphosphotransferase